MKIVHHPGSDLQRGWSRKGTETTSRLRKENAETSPKGKGELLDEKVCFWVSKSNYTCILQSQNLTQI
jgi:hypothetical protein